MPSFCYYRPSSLAEALGLLVSYEEEARPLAGGQSLLPLMAARLVAPAALIDLSGIPDFDRIEVTRECTRLGAGVTWRQIERHRQLADAQPLLCEAVTHIAHYQIRNRGTVGGSLAHADPAAELPAIAVVCDGEVALQGPSGLRVVPAAGFFHGTMTTALSGDEILVSLRLPPWPPGRRWAFREFALRKGDFAVAGVALHFDLDDGRIRAPRLCCFGIGDRPVRLKHAEDALEGLPPLQELFRVAGTAAAEMVEPQDEARFPADYRRSLLATLVARALTDATERTHEDASDRL